MLQITWQLLQFAALLLLAFAAYGWYRRGRRVGEGPHCAKCDYDLSDGERDRCPECGALLGENGAIARGALERPIGRAILATACAVGAVSAGGSAFWQYAFTTQAAGAKSIAKLLDNLARADRPDDTPENPAYVEILRRAEARGWKALAPELERHILSRLAASPETGWMSINESGLMRGAFHRGDLSPRAEEAVAGHYVVLSIRVPPVVRAGDQVEVYLDHQYSTGNGWVRYEVTPKSQELRPFRFATRLKDRQPEFFMGVLRLQPGPHSIDFECRRMIAAKSTEKETDTTDYRVVRSDARCHVDVYAGSEFDDAMRVALQSVVELLAWAEYSPKNYDVLMNFSRPCPLDGELIIDVRDGDQRRSLGSIPIRCGRALSLSARSADKCFSTGDTLQMWCRFLPASATLNSAGKPFSPVEWGPFSVKRVRSLRVSQVLRLEPTRK